MSDWDTFILVQVTWEQECEPRFISIFQDGLQKGFQNSKVGVKNSRYNPEALVVNLVGKQGARTTFRTNIDWGTLKLN